MVFNIFFLRNATFRFLLEEFKISIFTMGIMNIYLMCLYTISGVAYFEDHRGDIIGENTVASKLFLSVFFLDIIGILQNLLVFPLYCAVTYFVYAEMRDWIVMHLDGNRIMFSNFKEVTMTRGILKLDVLANLQYFSCFSMIMFEDEIKHAW